MDRTLSWNVSCSLSSPSSNCSNAHSKAPRRLVPGQAGLRVSPPACRAGAFRSCEAYCSQLPRLNRQACYCLQRTCCSYSDDGGGGYESDFNVVIDLLPARDDNIVALQEVDTGCERAGRSYSRVCGSDLGFKAEADAVAQLSYTCQQSLLHAS